MTRISGSVANVKCEIKQIGKTFKTHPRRREAVFECHCGKTFVAIVDNVRRKHTKSCGCNLPEKHGKVGTGVYRSWKSMWQRCNAPEHTRDFRNYSSRGISICDRWKQFSAFAADMGERPKGMSLERKNNNAGYGPDNCKWATPTEQGCNRRSTKNIEYRGEVMCIKHLAKKMGIKYLVVWKRLNRGWSIEDAVETPVGRTRSTEEAE